MTTLAQAQKPNTSAGSYALIAGGSKGIGYALAEALAKRGYNLVLIARNVDTLNAAKAKLEQQYGVQVEILSKDLSKETTAKEIGDWCKERDLPLKILCNVAGLGGVHDYLEGLSTDSIRYMMRLNIESAVMLTHELIPVLEKNSPSHILNVASMAGLAPMPQKNIYSATKSAILFFSYSLRNQLKKRDITVSCLAPGPVFTKPEVIQTTMEELGWFGKIISLQPERVGEVTVRKMLKGRMVIVPGTVSRVSSSLLRILPRRWAAGIYWATYKKK